MVEIRLFREILKISNGVLTNLANKIIPELGLKPHKDASDSIVNQEIESLEDFSHLVNFQKCLFFAF